MNTQTKLHDAPLRWEVSDHKRRTTFVLAVNRYCAERDGSIKLGVAQWLVTARLCREQSALASLGVA